MQNRFTFFVTLAPLFILSTAHAEVTHPLGKFHVAAQVDAINFTDRDLEDLDADEQIFISILGYFNAAQNLYLGAEVGFANLDDSERAPGVTLKTDLDYIPFELNIKYLAHFQNNLVLGLGGGFSLNYVDGKISGSLPGLFFVADGDELLLGGQMFVELSYRTGHLFLGAHIKYQLTEELDELDIDFSNIRAGGHIGLIF
jgi:catechol 2,3-dioxygenase-like lactoylglutathione lyase family enzyme